MTDFVRRLGDDYSHVTKYSRLLVFRAQKTIHPWGMVEVVYDYFVYYASMPF